MDAASAPLRFSCPSCGQSLAAPPELAGRQISCPKCGATAPVIAGGPEEVRVSRYPKLAALVGLVFGGVTLFQLAGRPGEGEKHDAPDPGGEPAAVYVPTLADRVHGKPVKRSGSKDPDKVFLHYEKGEGASTIMFSTQEEKGKLAILPGRLVIDQVGGVFITATHTGSGEQWVLYPDDPLALERLVPPEGISIARLAGVYAGPEKLETTSGAPASLPAMIVFGMLTTHGYLDFENPDAPRASAADLRSLAVARIEEAKREKEKRIREGEEAYRERLEREEEEARRKAEARALDEKREAERTAARKAEEAEMEAALAAREAAWQEEERARRMRDEEELRQDRIRRKREEAEARLAAARADLAGVCSRIDSERKRHAGALKVINALTRNKTVAVKEGSPAYHRCMEASRIIGEVERGAPALKAERARLETLVSELEQSSQ